jgi:hypothetical protein
MKIIGNCHRYITPRSTNGPSVHIK